MKRGIVLQGGGAKGAYEAGAIRALDQKRIKFDCACGTSIGAINAAFYATRNLSGMYHLWQKTDSEELFGIDGRILDNLHNGTITAKDIKKGISSIVKIIKNNGVDTTKIKDILAKNINPDRFMRSRIDFAMNTYNLSDMKPVEVFKKDIPKEKLIEYILSSAYLPFFKFEKIIDDKYYMDGGIYSDCPVDMLIDAGYDEIYVIKAWQSKIKYQNKKGVKVHVITPRENLGSIVRFTPNASEYRMNLGYYDTLKYLYNLDGNKYYFKYYSEKYYSGLFDKTVYKKIIKKYDIGFPPKNDKEFIIKTLEKVCKEMKIERFKIYNLPYLLTRLKYKMVACKKSEYYDFIKNIKVEFE